MAHDPEDELSVQVQKFLNATGFPFQLFVQNLLAEQVLAGPHLRGAEIRYRLEPLADELGWQEGSAFGFIDSVVGAAVGPDWRIRYVVETKRHDEGVAWLFLRSSQQGAVQPTAALLRAWANSPKPNYRQWSPFVFDPPTEMASFCMIADLEQGKRHGERPEEIIGQLLRGVEALAVQEPMLRAPLGSLERTRSTFRSWSPIALCTWRRSMRPKSMLGKAGCWSVSEWTGYRISGSRRASRAPC